MRVRAFTDLAGTNDDEFLRSVATGLQLIDNHSRSILAAGDALLQLGRLTPASILYSFAKEEAAKFLILLDAVRCPRGHQKLLTRQLADCGKHLARGIYAEVAHFHPATFKELVGLIEPMRAKFFLDGPEGFEWIFRNAVLDRRESDLYVDYVDPGDDEPGYWKAPRNPEFPKGIDAAVPCALVEALVHVGASSENGLGIVAQIWRSFEPSAETHWREVHALNNLTIDALQDAGLFSPSLTNEHVLEVCHRWTFPLWGVDLAENPVELKDLQAERAKLEARALADHHADIVGVDHEVI